MEMRDVTYDRPLSTGDVVRLGWCNDSGQLFLQKYGDVWTIERILPQVFCLGDRPGVRVSRAGRSMWISFPQDLQFGILERLSN